MANENGVTHVAESDRVRARTHPAVNSRIDKLAEYRIRAAAAEPDPTARLKKLEREWDIERILEAEVAATGLLGLTLAMAADRRYLFMSGLATSMMLLHALHGWYPLLPLLRRLGVRTQNEIDRERYAIKALRGDFSDVKKAEADARAEAAWRAVHA